MILPGLEQGSGNHRRLSRWWARAEMLAVERGQTLLGLGTLLVACAYLLRELAPDVGRKPLHPDEAVTGLVAARPLPEMLSTVLVERGGPPFHFLAAHVALLFDPSAQALRWTSVAFALGTVLLCYDLGRRIAGHTAGATAALVAATSTMLGQLGTFGRMYAAFAFTAALAADMFYRALEQRTTRAAVVAALAAVLAAATHTYGIFILLAEAVVALVLWRGRPLRAAVPVALVGLLMVPVLLAYMRLSERFSVGVEEGSSLSSPEGAVRHLHNTLAGISGGRQVLLLFAVLAVFGTILVIRRQPAFLALWAAVAAPPALYLLVSGSGSVALSPRHMIYVLPLWVTLIGAGFARLTGRLPLVVQALLLAAVGLVGAEFHSIGAGDPRGAGVLGVALGKRQALSGPASWLRAHVQPADVLYQYSPPFLAALDTTQHAVTVGPGPGGLLPRGLERVDYPVSAVVLALPVAGAELDAEELHERLGEQAEIELTPEWLVVRRAGPFADEDEVLLALAGVFGATQESLLATPPKVENRIRSPFNAVCSALAANGHEPAECRARPADGR